MSLSAKVNLVHTDVPLTLILQVTVLSFCRMCEEHQSEMFEECEEQQSECEECDVVVVGGGLSGLCAARRLKERNQNLTVLVLEAKGVFTD